MESFGCELHVWQEHALSMQHQLLVNNQFMLYKSVLLNVVRAVRGYYLIRMYLL